MAGAGRERVPDGETDEFTRRLRDLQSDGSAVLVTGSGSREVHAEMCRRLLGEGSSGPRHRLLVLTNGIAGVDERLPGGADDGETRVITAAATRSTSVAPSQATGLDVVDLGDASLPAIGARVVEAVEGIERRNGPLDATQLRLGVDSLAALLDAHGEHAVFRFLLYATAYVRQLDALGHVHLPVERDAYVVQLLAPLFDAVVEVRVREGWREQRWHLADGVSSRWLAI